MRHETGVVRLETYDRRYETGDVRRQHGDGYLMAYLENFALFITQVYFTNFIERYR